MLTIPKAALAIGMHRAVLWRHVQRGHLKTEQHGPYVLIDSDELARFQATKRKAGRPRKSA